MKVSVKQLEDVTNKIDYMLSSVIGNSGDSLMSALNKIANSVGGHGFQNKSIMEHKSIQYLDKLTGDKKQYNLWLEKMKNSFDQVDGHYRQVISILEKALI